MLKGKNNKAPASVVYTANQPGGKNESKLQMHLKQLNLNISPLFCIKLALQIIIGISSIFCTPIFGQSNNDNTPNVILIISDDMNDWIEPYNGHPQTKTPNLSKLASQGITFTNAWPTVSWCNPSRVSIITGVHPLQSGIVSNEQFPYRDYLPHASTIIDSFNDKGYHTIGLGKVLHKPSDDELESWDEFYPYNTAPRPSKHPAHGVQSIVDLKNDTYDWGALNAPASDWGDYQSTTHAINFIKSEVAANKPFFMTLGYRLPHLPFYYPEKFDDFLGDDIISLPNDSSITEIRPQLAFEIMQEKGVWSSAIKSYLASIHFVDYNIGRLLRALETNPTINDNTIIIFISDHGYHIGEKKRWGKVTLWNEALRTPCIMKIPQYSNRAGETISNPINFLDLYPTLEELTKMKLNPWLSGKSLVKLLNGEESTFENISVLPDDRYAYTDSRYKYIQGRDHEMLFDYTDFEEHDFGRALISPDMDLLNSYKQSGQQMLLTKYSPFYRPPPVANIRFTPVTDGIVMNWKEIDKNAIYQIKICRESNCRAEEIEELHLDSAGLDVGYFNHVRIRSTNPKYNSAWSRRIRFTELIKTWPLEKVLALNPDIKIYNLAGQEVFSQERLSLEDYQQKFHKEPELIYVLSMKFDNQYVSRKIAIPATN